MELKQTNQQKQTKIPSVHVYLNVTTPVVGLMLNEEQSMEYVCVAPTSGSVTSNDGFPIVVPAFITKYINQLNFFQQSNKLEHFYITFLFIVECTYQINKTIIQQILRH